LIKSGTSRKHQICPLKREQTQAAAVVSVAAAAAVLVVVVVVLLYPGTVFDARVYLS